MENAWPWFLLMLALLVLARVYLRAPENPLDREAGRRKARKPFKRDARTYANFGVKSSEEYVRNSRGVEIFTKQWLPVDGQLRGLVFYCHGYGDTCSYLFDDVAIRLAAAQYAVASMDYEGHGQSSGLHVYIKNFDNIVRDVVEYTDLVKQRDEFRDLPCFLYGESMGGAVALKVHRAQPGSWDGAILLAPMCKIADHMVPPAIVVLILKGLAKLFPQWKLVPSQDICGVAFRDPEKRQLGYMNPTAYKGKPRLGTALQLLATSDEIEAHLHEVTIPLLILHGGADIVTDPSVSKALYEQSISKDKTFHLYPKSWHALIAGEPDDVVDKVMVDIFSWLNARSRTISSPSVLFGSKLGTPLSNLSLEEDALSTVTG